MLDHIGFNVRDLTASRAFYDRALEPLGVSVLMSVGPEQTGGPTHVGYGRDDNPFFWISSEPGHGNRLHVAFRVDNEWAVQAFHAAALAAGGTDNGAPGPRPQYHPGYYAAFVLDPDGHNVEAVFHGHRG
jgi:catechol 2,3-dioxygenase-like lactoylglutathione lyase family enzyme